MVEVLKTTIEDDVDAEALRTFLGSLHPTARITFDLDDCDRILRIESPDTIDIRAVVLEIRSRGFDADPLEDLICT